MKVEKLLVNRSFKDFNHSKIEIYTVKGVIEDYDVIQIITINVYKKFDGVENCSTVMNKRIVISLSQTRKVYY